MIVLLVDVDSKISNLALMKISAYHKLLGDTVGFGIENPDKVYISCIFKKNAGQAKGIARYYPDAEIDIGGSGVDLKKQLPNEIEMIKPDYDLYPSTYSQDYTTRGCDRKCGFCIVPEKEGKIRIAQHPSEFADARFDTMMIMDNNLFAAPDDWQKQVFDWFENTSTKMLSPQGWDARLITEERWERLHSIERMNMMLERLHKMIVTAEKKVGGGTVSASEEMDEVILIASGNDAKPDPESLEHSPMLDDLIKHEPMPANMPRVPKKEPVEVDLGKELLDKFFPQEE